LDAAFLASLEFTKARNQFPANPDLTICVREGRGSEFMDDVACGDRKGARLRPRPRLHGVYGQLGIKNGAAKFMETILPLLTSNTDRVVILAANSFYELYWIFPPNFTGIVT
jgi:hypothetical protein